MCPYCSVNEEIKGFGGYLHYISTKRGIENNIRNGYIIPLKESETVSVYECAGCHEKWELDKPDFPAAGYFGRVTSADDGQVRL